MGLGLLGEGSCRLASFGGRDPLRRQMVEDLGGHPPEKDGVLVESVPQLFHDLLKFRRFGSQRLGTQFPNSIWGRIGIHGLIVGR